jgi:hypothetical protein
MSTMTGSQNAAVMTKDRYDVRLVESHPSLDTVAEQEAWRPKVGATK